MTGGIDPSCPRAKAVRWNADKEWFEVDFAGDGRFRRSKAGVGSLAHHARYWQPFDRKRTARRCYLRDRDRPGAPYHGMTPGQIMAKWAAKGAGSRESGKAAHEAMEKALGRSEWRVEENLEEDDPKELKWAGRVLRRMCREEGFTPFALEVPVYTDDRSGVVGFIDCLGLVGIDGDDLIVDVYDWKFDSHDLAGERPYRGRTGREECRGLPDVRLTRYFLQIGLYAEILRRHYSHKSDVLWRWGGKTYTGIRVRRCAIVHYHTGTGVVTVLPSRDLSPVCTRILDFSHALPWRSETTKRRRGDDEALDDSDAEYEKAAKAYFTEKKIKT